MVTVMRIYKSPGDRESRSVEEEFGWDDITHEILTRAILEFAAFSIEDMDARQL